MILLLFCLFAFFLGTIPFGLIIAKILGVNGLQKKGSGNIGATNVTRVAGFWPAGFFTFLFDFLKGALPVGLAVYTSVPRLLEQAGLGSFDTSLGLPVWLIGLCAVVGHCFTPWLHFKGGKGVASGFGVFAVLAPVSTLVGVAVFLIAYLITRTVSIASLSAAIFAFSALVVMTPNGAFVWAAAAITFLILIRHESNLDALLADSR